MLIVNDKPQVVPTAALSGCSTCCRTSCLPACLSACLDHSNVHHLLPQGISVVGGDTLLPPLALPPKRTHPV